MLARLCNDLDRLYLYDWVVGEVDIVTPETLKIARIKHLALAAGHIGWL